MGFRFRKSVNLGKGMKLNFNKKSVGVSFGTKGARFSVNSNGRKTASAGIPGTGLYYTKTSGGKSKINSTKKSSNLSDNNLSNNNICKQCGTVNDTNAKSCTNCGAKLNTASNTAVILWLIFFFPVGLFLMWKKTNWNKAIKIPVTIILVLTLIVGIANSDKNQPELPTSSTGITEIVCQYDTDINLDLSKQRTSNQTIYFNVAPNNEYDEADFNLVSSNTEIAAVEFERFSYGRVAVKILGLTTGETVVYIETTDGIIKSNEIKVTCTGEKETTTEPTTEETTTEETTKETTTEEKTTKDNSRTVYVTPSGEKYHFSKSCAGKNASERTLNEAKDIYDPCKKCAQ